MSKKIVFDCCLDSLRQLLSDARTTADAVTAEKLALALRFADELGKFWPGSVAATGSDGETADYETYRLLHETGLSQRQLVKIALQEELPAVRILRMLRALFGLTLKEAIEFLESCRQESPIEA
ncbi:hypothetical protein [Chitinimonas lacunae]|uniref:XRE family transcriptional regulator n=1 Tax=Chitinimonas lacunae TaxID=1963018 RepID=A0ABV8MR74_9NEIS